MIQKPGQARTAAAGGMKNMERRVLFLGEHRGGAVQHATSAGAETESLAAILGCTMTCGWAHRLAANTHFEPIPRARPLTSSPITNSDPGRLCRSAVGLIKEGRPFLVG